MNRSSEAPASSRVNAAVAGIEAITPPDSSQRSIDLADTPASHIRNVRLILELAAFNTRASRGKAWAGEVVLDRQAIADVENKLGSALVLLDTAVNAAQLAETIAAFTPGLVVVDPVQLGLGIVPRQSAPAFAKQAGAR